MLVLSRKETEQIMIGDDIVLTVVLIQGGKVRLGIDAPKSVSVRRPRKPAPGAKRPGKDDDAGV